MSPAGSWEPTQRMAYGLGLAMCLSTPLLGAALMLAKVLPPGAQAPEGATQQVGYLFTGLVFLAAAWVWWRSGRALEAFAGVAEAHRGSFVIRETVLSAAACEVSALAGIAYWALAGSSSGRHVVGFLVLTPALFLGLVPRRARWARAAEASPASTRS